MSDAFKVEAHADEHEAIDGLQALIAFSQLAFGADMVLAFEANDAGLATPLASAPQALPQPFMLDGSQIEQLDWSHGPIFANDLRIPVPVLLALGMPAKFVHFIPTPVANAPRSGILLLWVEQGEHDCTCTFRTLSRQSVSMLTEAFIQLMTDRRNVVQRRLMKDRFFDLFASVPSGIVILGSEGRTALLNEPAAALLGGRSGEVEAAVLAGSMRTLRESCTNAAELQSAYSALIGDVDYAAMMLWNLGDRQFNVDTHPIRGDGLNGRIWLFNEVSAQYRLEHDLRGLALTDPLTGLANRRQFIERGSAMLRQSRLDDQQLSVLMLDIDHFKSINDLWGHHVGDIVLQTFAKRCQSKMRDQDLIARLGGEEFAVLLPGVSALEGSVIAERLRAAITDTLITADDVHIHATVSIGGITVLPDDQTIDQLLERADQCLYEAKRTGRNKVVFR